MTTDLRHDYEVAVARIVELEAEVKRMRSLADDAIEYISPYLGIDETIDERTQAYEALVNIRDGEE